MTEIKFLGKYLVSAELECMTGLHIGGTKESVEIGGLDSPVIRDTVTDKPYIPGSSLKGKLRSIAEFKNGTVDKSGKPHVCGEPGCVVCRIFGTTDGNNGVSRIIMRDAFLTNAEEMEGGDKSYTEIKTENTIDRIRGKTIKGGLRTTERVPKGAKFRLELVYTVYQEDDLTKIKHLFELFPVLEDDTLGGSGSRGYGRVKFENVSVAYRPTAYYAGNPAAEKKASFRTFAEACEKVASIEEMAR